MRHIKKRHPFGCGVAVTAMVCEMSYARVCASLPAHDFNTAGILVTSLTALLRALAPARKWRIIGRPVPIPFRHYTPTIERGILTIQRITPTAVTYTHFVAYERGWLLDPDADRRIRLSDAKNSKEWRSWLVLNEITGDPPG
jgi:hypothetical protein